MITHHREVATTIMQQLKINGGLVKIFSWGARAWVACPAGDEHFGALRFRVSGRKFTGIVEIALMPSDTYRVTLIKPWKKAVGGVKIIQQVGDIYFDVLTDVVDRLVETA